MAVDLNIIEIAADGAETEPPLVVAHGLFGSAKNFSSLGRKLADGRRVVLVDMRNHGESPWDDDVTYPAMAEDLADVIRTHCGGRAVVLGHSMGGKAAMALALEHEDLLAGLIVADIAPIAYDHTHQPFITAMRAADLTGVTRRSQVDPMLADAIPIDMMRAFILQNLLIEDGTARWRLNLVALDEGMPDLIGWPRALMETQFGVRALFVYGGASDYMSPLLQPRVLEQFPKAQFDAIPGAGHWLHAEKPAEFLSIVSGWLDSL
ncbi:MAG: alpha/beta fold hydrolase [Pseudomonadota bacterium]